MFVEKFKFTSHPFQLGNYSCATFLLQWSELNLSGIFLFDILLLVNNSTFVALLWLFQLDICLYYYLLLHLYYPLITICLNDIMIHSLPLNLQIYLFWNYLLLPQKKNCIIQFHLGPEIDLFVVEYWLTCFCPFHHIRNCLCGYFCCYWFFLLLHIFHCQKIIHHNSHVQSIQNRILSFLIYLLCLIPVACRPDFHVHALVWLYFAWLVFWSSFDVL